VLHCRVLKESPRGLIINMGDRAAMLGILPHAIPTFGIYDQEHHAAQLNQSSFTNTKMFANTRR
jgi:hypothetical protein